MLWSSYGVRSPTIVVVSPPNSGADSWTTRPLTKIVNSTVDSGSPSLASVTVAVGGGHSRPATLTRGTAAWSQSGVGV